MGAGESLALLADPETRFTALVQNPDHLEPIAVDPKPDDMRTRNLTAEPGANLVCGNA